LFFQERAEGRKKREKGREGKRGKEKLAVVWNNMQQGAAYL
jgi:hypothetical protein